MIGFIVAFSLTLLSYLIHTISHWQEHHSKRSWFSHKIVSTIIDLGFVTWGAMIYFDPVRADWPLGISLPIGLALGFVGILLVILSTQAKEGFDKTDRLITKGVYSKIRHPMYLGMILTFIGFPLAFQTLLTLSSIIVWLPMILLWRYWEEQDLKKRFGQKYLDYQSKTWL